MHRSNEETKQNYERLTSQFKCFEKLTQNNDKKELTAPQSSITTLNWKKASI